MAPKVDSRRFWLPNLCGFDAGQINERAVFRSERDVLICFGHNSRFASDGVTHHAKPVFCANDEGEKAVIAALTEFAKSFSVEESK